MLKAFLPAVLSSSMSNLGNPMSESCGIPDNPPSIFEDEDIEVEDDDVTEDDEKELIFDDEDPFSRDDPESIPSIDPDPPNFMPSIIFFIMSSISRPPPPMDMPPPMDGKGAPLEDVIMDEDEAEEDEKDMEDLVNPSGDSVVAAIN